jgi:hypothetical protein
MENVLCCDAAQFGSTAFTFKVKKRLPFFREENLRKYEIINFLTYDLMLFLFLHPGL